MSADAFIEQVRTSLRRSLFQRLRPLGLSQDEVNRLVSHATSRAMILSGIQELAAVAIAAGPVADALQTAAPDSPALVQYRNVREQVRDPIRNLMQQEAQVEV
nr:hypothetical protein [Brevundimonas diminuta]